MELTLAFTKSYCRELIRNTSALFFTLFFPAILLIFFGKDSSGNNSDTLISFIIYCNFAVQSVMLQALGISIAAARANPWRNYLQTLPATNTAMTLGRILSSLIFSTLSVSIVVAANYFHHGMTLTLSQNALIIFCALIGGVPMGLLAVFLGSLFNPAAARGGFIFLNTLLLFGALTLSSDSLFREFIPSYQWMMFTLTALSSLNFASHLLWLVFYAVIFYLLIRFTQK